MKFWELILFASVFVLQPYAHSKETARPAVEDGTVTNSLGVTWKNAYWHAVNMKASDFITEKGKKEKALSEFLKNDVVIAEADIRFNSKGELVMAHDAQYAEGSDKPGHAQDRLTFKEWFLAIAKSPVRFKPETHFGCTKKGMKLDIKENLSPEFKKFGLASDAVIRTIQEVLKDPRSGLTSQDVFGGRVVIANADVVLGPGERGKESLTRAALNVEDLKK
ncbi:MAG: hypothetical protein AB1540_12760, partial [Bdellovibrionota bacterium]